MVAAATLGAGILGAGASLFGASEQSSAASHASDLEFQEQGIQRGLLQNFVNQGNFANQRLDDNFDSLTAPINMNESTLQQTPGYQFNLTQGLKSVQNSAAARGLGVSGAALKGAAGYATGLADSTYQNQFSNAQTNRQTAFNMLSNQQQLGENAAAGAGTGAITTGNEVASNTIGAGNALAAGGLSAANSLGSAGISSYLLPNLLSSSNYFGGTSSYGGSDAAQDAIQDSGGYLP